MADPVRVRFPCQHDIWFRHMVKPVGVKPVWCEGGQTKLLRQQEFLSTFNTDDGWTMVKAWVEVEE